MFELLIIALPITAVLSLLGLLAWGDWRLQQSKRQTSRVFMVDVKRQ